MSMEECSVAIWPFLVVSISGLILITSIPAISLFSPRFFMSSENRNEKVAVDARGGL